MALLGLPRPQALHGPTHLHPALSCLVHQLCVMWALWMGTFLGAGGIAVTRTAEGLLPES